MSEFTPEPQVPTEGATPEAAWPENVQPEASQSVGADAVDPSAPQPASDPATGDVAAPSPAEVVGAPAPDAAEVPSSEPAPDSTDQPTDGVVKPDEQSGETDETDETDADEEQKELPVQALSDLPPDADPNPAFHGEGQEPQAGRPEPEARTAYSDDPAPFTVV